MAFTARLLTDLTEVFDSKFIEQNEFNYKKMQDFIDTINEYRIDHKTKEKDAHNTTQIAHKDNYVGNTSLDKMLIYQMERIRNLVLGVDGDGIKEVTDSRVSINGKTHGLLSERLFYDFNGVDDKFKEMSKRFIDINLDEYDPDKTGTVAVNEKIQDALDRIRRAKGGRLYIPAGVYLLDKILLIYENTTLELNDNAVLLRGKSNEILMNGPTEDAFYGYSGRGNIHVKGGTFDSNYEQIKKYPTTAANMFNLKHAENITVENVKFRNVITYHALDINGVKNLRIKDCVFEGYINLGSSEVKESIQISEYTRDGAAGNGYFDGTPCKDVIVSGCTFRKSDILGPPNVGVGNHFSVNNIWQSNIIIRDNLFDGVGTVGVRPYKWLNVRIENNTFRDMKQGIRISSVGYKDVSANNADGTPSGQPQAGAMYFITNNFFDNYSNFGITVYGNQSGGKSAIVHTININGNIFNCDNDDTGEAVNLSLSSNIHIKDNTITRGIRGIRFVGCNTIFIDKNYINNVRHEAIYNTKSDYTGYPQFERHIHITNNLINTTGRNGLYLQFAKNFFVRNNTVTNTNQQTADDTPRGGIYVTDCDTGAIEGNHLWGTEKDFAVRVARTKYTTVFNNGGSGEIYLSDSSTSTIGYWNVKADKISRTETKEV